MAKGIQWDGGPYTGTFIVYGAFDCRTSPYRPAIFTAVDDDTAGDVIAGVSTGSPTNSYRGSLWFDTTRGRTELGWEPTHSNVSMLIESYEWFLAHRRELAGSRGSHHQSLVPMGLLRVLSWGGVRRRGAPPYTSPR